MSIKFCLLLEKANTNLEPKLFANSVNTYNAFHMFTFFSFDKQLNAKPVDIKSSVYKALRGFEMAFRARKRQVLFEKRSPDVSVVCVHTNYITNSYKLHYVCFIRAQSRIT